MVPYSLEREIDKVEESVRICKLNIENQEKKLQELNKKASILQSKLESANSITSTDLENLMNIDIRLKYYTELKKLLILEFQRALNLYEKKLQSLKADPKCIDL